MEKSLALRSRFELEGRAANTSKDSVIISAEDYARLEERLQNAEKLAIDMSQTGAKSFARSARTIAYLEGGNERMQTLLDHFRIVNIKLTSDVKLAREEALRAKGLEHRLKLSEESEKNTRNRLQQVENQLKLKEKEILENLQFAQDNNNRKNDNFDNEIRNLSDKLRSAQEQYLGLLKQYKVDKEVYEQSTRSLSDENQALNMQLSLLKSENMSLAQRVNECDMEITSLRMTLRERDDKLMISESSLSIVKQDHEINSESWNRKRRELEEDIADKIEFNRNLERQITMLKDSLRDAEMIHLKKDEIIGTFVAKQTEMVEENRQLRSKLDAVTADLFNFTHANSDLAAKLKEVEDELMESRNMYEDLKDIVHRDQALKLADAETQLRLMTDNATDLQSKLTKLEQDNEEILNQLSTSEIRVSSLQTSLAEAQGQLQAFTTNTDNFMSENKHLRQQLDQVTTKFAVQSREMSALRDVLAEKDIEIGLRENRIKEVEDQLAQAQQKLTQLEEAEAELSTELKVFGDMLMSGTLTEMSHRFESKYEDSDYMVAHYSSTNSKLQMLRQTLLNVKNKATSIEKQQMKTREVARVMREEFDELKDECNQLKKQLNLVTIERDNIHTQLAVHMEQLTTVGRECREALDDKEQLLSSAEEFAQRIRSLLRTLDGAIADAVSRAGVITAGKLMGFQGDKIHLSPSQLISSREFIGSSGNPILDKTNVDYGASALLARSVSDIEHTLNSLCQALETLAEDSTAKKAALDKVELTLSEKELTFAKDRAFFLDRISSLEKNLEHNQKSLTVSQLDSKALQNEIDILKEQLNEVTSKNSEIELEFNDALNNIEALKSALSDAESLVMESRARMRSMQTDIDNRNNEIKSLHDEIDSGRKKLMDAIIQLEKTNNNLERIKSEKDAVDNVRKSLESELDRSRVEANNLKLQARNNVQDVKSSFEVEKLLAALGTTLDQVSNTLTPLSAATTTSTSGSRSNLLTPISSGSPTMDNMSVPQTDRVDSAVKRLGDLRIWCRDEFRSRRILEEKIESLQRDLLASQTAAEDAQSHWKRLMASSNDRDVEVREKAREISDLQATMARKQEEIDRLKKDLSNARDELDEEKRSKQKLSSESQAKDSEIFRQRLEHESLTATIARLQEQLSSSKDRINELSNDAEQKAEQVLVCKANNARLSATLEMLERGFDKDRNDRGLMEQRLLDFDNNSGSVERFKVKIAELENSLSALREKCHNITREKDTAQMALERQTIELDSLRRKLTTVEARLEGCNKEKQSMTAQIDNVRQTVAQMKIKVESEVSLRLKAEAALQAINNEKKPFGDHYSALVDEVADNLKKDEDEKQALRNQIHSLKLTMEYKESQYSVNEEKTRSLERELHRLMSQVGDWNNEIESMQLRSRALRREGKKARSRILHASRTVNEIINMAKADVSATGFGIVSPHNNYDTLHMKAILSATTPSTRSGLDELDFEHGFDDSFSTDDNIPLLGLEKALGLDDLVSLVDNLQHITTWIRDIPRNQMEMQAVIQRLENEKIRLTKELNESEVRGEERVMKLRQEVQQLNIQLSELRRGDGMSNQLNLHISALENALRQERTEKEKAVNLNQKYREESQIISLELANAQQEILMLRNGTNQITSSSDYNLLKSEEKRLREEVQTLKKELKAVNHHRGVLRETVDQLEREVRGKVDSLAEALAQAQNDVSAAEMALNGSGLSLRERFAEDEEALRRQVSRYRVRALAMEELVAIYRAGVIALYADGASYGAAQYGWQNGEDMSDGLGVSWIEREINTIKRSYDEEMKLLEAEINELRGKLRQSGSYIGELRKRFEENMKAMYRYSRRQHNLQFRHQRYMCRPGRDNASEGLMLQFEQTSHSLEQCEAEIKELKQSLIEEKASHRHRHSSLIEELSKALQARDASLQAVKRLEECCKEAGIKHVAVYESLRAELMSKDDYVKDIGSGRHYTDNHSSPSTTMDYSKGKRNKEKISEAADTKAKQKRDNDEREGELKSLGIERLMEKQRELYSQSFARKANLNVSKYTSTTSPPRAAPFVVKHLPVEIGASKVPPSPPRPNKRTITPPRVGYLPSYASQSILSTQAVMGSDMATSTTSSLTALHASGENQLEVQVAKARANSPFMKSTTFASQQPYADRMDRRPATAESGGVSDISFTC